MRYIFLSIFLVSFASAEFITSFDEVPPAKEVILGEPIDANSYDDSNILGQKIDNNQVHEQDIEKVEPYREVRVEDLRGYGTLKVALLVPKKVIKGYAKKVSNSILSYLIFRDEDFTFEVFDSIDESEDNLVNTLLKIKSNGYKFVIAPLTPVGARIVKEYEKDMLVYIPTLHKSLFSKQGNIYYGGVDYKKQIDKLLKYSNQKIAIFMGKSWLAQKLTEFIQDKRYSCYVKAVASSKINPKYIVKNNYNLQNASVFFNTPLVTSALLASSFSTYNIKPYGLFSTQINYSPHLFTMIQRKDRQNFYIANSIDYVNSKLDDINQNLGIKIKYNWVAYSTSIGIDYIYSRFYGEDPIFNEDMINHQVKYRVKIVKIKDDEFVKVK